MKYRQVNINYEHIDFDKYTNEDIFIYTYWTDVGTFHTREHNLLCSYDWNGYRLHLSKAKKDGVSNKDLVQDFFESFQDRLNLFITKELEDMNKYLDNKDNKQISKNKTKQLIRRR